MPEHNLLALAEKTSENDLAFLLKAKEEAKRRMKDDPSKDKIKAFESARSAVEAEAARLQSGTPGLAFKEQLDAVDYLTAQGFKVSKSKFNRDLKKGLVATTPEGLFEAQILLAYAVVHLVPLAKAEDKAGSQAVTRKLDADAQYKQIATQRQELKLKKEQGLLMARADHEQDLAARAAFFKAEIEGFIHRQAGPIIALVGGDEGRVSELIHWWAEATADWMDAWSADREFTVPDEDEPLADDLDGDGA